MSGDDGLRSATAGVTTDGGVVSEIEEDENGELTAPAGSTTAMISDRIIDGMTDYDDDPAWVQRAIRARAMRVADDIFRRLAEGQQPSTGEKPGAEAPPQKDPEPVDPVLFSLCVERVARSMVDDRATPLDRPLTVVVTPKAFAKYTVDLIAPLLLEAGAKQERERIKARVERLQPNHEPNFVVNASPEAKANFKGLDDMWRAVLASITEEGKGE